MPRPEVLAEGETEREELESRARENEEEVTDYVVDLFEEAVHAQT